MFLPTSRLALCLAAAHASSLLILFPPTKEPVKQQAFHTHPFVQHEPFALLQYLIGSLEIPSLLPSSNRLCKSHPMRSLNDMYCYDTAAREWTAVEPQGGVVPPKRSYHAMAKQASLLF